MSSGNVTIESKYQNILDKYNRLQSEFQVYGDIPPVNQIPSFITMNDDYLVRAIITLKRYSLNTGDMPEKFRAISDSEWLNIFSIPEPRKSRKDWLKRSKETIFVYIAAINYYASQA